MNTIKYSNLTDFLLKHKVGAENKDKVITHTRIGCQVNNIYGASYSIQDNEWDTFMKLYINEIVINKTKNEYLTEKQIQYPTYSKVAEDGVDDMEYGPILVDFDFRYDITTITKRQHTKDDIENMIVCYTEIIKQLFQFSEGDVFNIYIMEKPNVIIDNDKNIVKDGIHMIIGIQMNHIMQEILRERVLKEIGDIWRELPITNTYDNVLDGGITKGTTNWQLYGSKKPNNDAYQLTYHYKVSYDISDGEFIIDKEPLSKFNSFVELSARYKHNLKLPYNKNIIQEYNNRIYVKYNTKPLSSSYSLFTNKSRVRIRNNEEDEVVPLENITNHEILEKEMQKILDKLTPAEQYIKDTHLYAQVLPEKYYCAGSHALNRQVAFALKDTSPDLFLSWIMLRSKADDFDFSTIPKLYNDWNKYFVEKEEGKRVTRGSILYWAKKDAYKEYVKIKNSSINHFINQTILSTTEYDYACVLYQLKKDQYVCASIHHNIWYVFNNHRWEIDKGNTLRICISTEMYNLYYDKCMEITDELIKTEDVDKKEELGKKQKHMNLIASNLKRTSIKNNIMREAQELFYKKDFLENLDANPELLGCENGIIDFSTKTFREGRPEDYVSKSTGIHYIPYNQLDKNIMDEIYDFMNKLFPIPELNQYMWEHLASTLNGKIINQTFNMYTGCGSNGKSLLTELMSKTLGEYKGTVPLSLITEKRSLIGGVSPEVMQLKNIRYAVFQEASKGMKMNEGPVKEMTGGDPITGRSLYRDSETFYPQFSLVMCTNVALIIGSNDEGTWRRIRYVPFLSKFVDENYVKKDEDKYVFLKDMFLNKKFKIWTPVFLSMLIQKAYETDCIVNDCSIVLEKSNEYRESQDHISLFIKSRLLLTKNTDNYVDKKTMYQEFKLWRDDNSIKTKIPTSTEFIEEMSKKLSLKGNKWIGCSIRNEEGDVNDGEEEV